MDGDPQARLTKDWEERAVADPRYEDHKDMNAWFKETFGTWYAHLASDLYIVKPMLSPARLELDLGDEVEHYDIINPTKERILEIAKFFKEYIKSE